MGKSRPQSISISANQIREFSSLSPCGTEPYNKGKYETAVFCVRNCFRLGPVRWVCLILSWVHVYTISCNPPPLSSLLPVLTWEWWYDKEFLHSLLGFGPNFILLPSHNFSSSDAQCWTTWLWFLCRMLHLPWVPICTNEGFTGKNFSLCSATSGASWTFPTGGQLISTGRENYLNWTSLLLRYLKDSNAATHSVDSDMFKVLHYNLYFVLK